MDLTPDEILQVTGGSDGNTTMPTMSQTSESFKEATRMSNELLEYIGEPHDHFQEPATLTPELDREMGMASHFDNPDKAQTWATQTETIICLEPTDIWGPRDANIHQGAGENPGKSGNPGSRGSGRGGGGGGVGDAGGGGGAPLPPGGAAGGHGGDKLFRQPPNIFTGDQTKMKEFLMHWELYYNLNHLSNVMGVPYS